MALNGTALTPPTNTSWNTLGSSTTAVASCSAITRSASANVTDHEVVITINGPATFTASSTTVVNFFAYGSIDGTNWSGTSGATNELVDGTDKAITFSANGNNGIYLGSVALVATAAGTSVAYKSKILSIAAAFGGTVPAKYVIVAQNQAGAALAASGHSVAVQEMYYN